MNQFKDSPGHGVGDAQRLASAVARLGFALTMKHNDPPVPT
jgi:hypothetical protein